MPYWRCHPTGPRCRDVTETVDLIELNHFYDDLGRHAYDQVIFYEWSPDYRRFHVIAWCLVENDLSRMPTRNPKKRRVCVVVGMIVMPKSIV